MVDGSDFRFPRDYLVSVYNRKLEHQDYYISAYKTESQSTLIYALHKLSVKVTIQLIDSGIIITYIGPYKGTLKLSKNTDVKEILMIALSSALDMPVTISDSNQLTLF